MRRDASAVPAVAGKASQSNTFQIPSNLVRASPPPPYSHVHREEVVAAFLETCQGWRKDIFDSRELRRERTVSCYFVLLLPSVTTSEDVATGSGRLE